MESCYSVAAPFPWCGQVFSYDLPLEHEDSFPEKGRQACSVFRGSISITVSIRIPILVDCIPTYPHKWVHVDRMPTMFQL